MVVPKLDLAEIRKNVPIYGANGFPVIKGGLLQLREASVEQILRECGVVVMRQDAADVPL